MKERLSKEMRDFVRVLQKNGYQRVRSKGSHFIYLNRYTHKHISINKNLNAMVKERLIKENNLII